jgi:hypothetical protein
MKYVTTKLMGGLGNYLFQIASTYAKSMDDKLKFIIDVNDITIAHSNPDNYKNNIFRKLKFQTLNESYYIWNEPSFNYTKMPEFKHNVKMVGYFQSEKYFGSRRKKILDIFSIDDETNNYLKTKYGETLNKNTCSLHVRRGDYVKLSKFHPPQSIEYYEEAIKIIGEDSHFLIFSDDIKWCKKNLSFIKNKTFIEGNTDYQDLYLMSMCKNNIIANSSFSWWGAWLNKNRHKKVVSPKLWFGKKNKHLNTDDIHCKKWVVI